VEGDLNLHGITRGLSLSRRVQMDGDSLSASGVDSPAAERLGIKPLSVTAVVKVTNGVVVTYRIVAGPGEPGERFSQRATGTGNPPSAVRAGMKSPAMATSDRETWLRCQAAGCNIGQRG